MGFVVDYLNSLRLVQDLTKVMESNQVEDLEYANQQVTCALLRWQQLFENPFVDRAALGLQPASSLTFAQYRNEVLHLLTQPNPSEKRMRAQTNDLLLQSAKKMMQGGADYDERLIKLLTMGACEFHGFNAVFTDSIREHGLNPNAKFHDAEDIGPIYKILAKTDKTMGNVKRDQNMLSLTPDPYVAHLHAKMSPEWFYFFCMGPARVNYAFLNRDYDSARKNLLNFPGADKLNVHERNQVYKFFDTWWKQLATDQSPKIAVMPMFRDPAVLQQKQNLNLQLLQKMGVEKTVKHIFDSRMYIGYENFYTQAIDPQFIQIVDIPSKRDLALRLEKIHAELSQAHAMMQSNYDTVKAFNCDEPERSL